MSENRAVRVAALLLLIAGTALAQVQNAADAGAGIYTSFGVAPGSQAFVTDSVGTLPAATGASVSIRSVGSATLIPAQVVSVRTTGITFVVPPDIPIGNAQLIYNQAGQLTQWTNVSIVASHLALYRGPLMPPLNADSSGATAPNGMANPVQPGEVLQLFATGLNAIPPIAPQVSLGGVPQSVSFAGRAGDGLLQINIQIAPGTPDGCYVPLTVMWGGNTATSFISKTSDGMPCHHPFGLPAQALQTLDSGGTVETGLISMTTALSAASADRASRSEQAVVLITYFSAAQIAGYLTANPVMGCGGSASEGGFASSVLSSPGQFGSSMTLQSGATTLTLPSNGGPEYSIMIPATADAPLNHLPAPVLSGGAWTWSSSAGQFGFNLLPPVQINGGAPIRIQTGQSQTITWDGSRFDAGAIMQLSLGAGNFGPATVTCFAPAQSGSLTIPANLLAHFTPGGVGVLTAAVDEVGPGTPHTYLQAQGTLMLVTRGSTDTRPVDFQ